ncbi:MAG: hypothetical protein A3J51_03200 [Omnitrophica WOR_2 bacterium RIFCSPHIGHO2_02_FULL_45_21]|nr:MAG: hypothetical protein A3J51_03200 [Omnitrophica WOR_2 bacterium RIFCSPHIGHO2_02_FULL_45_21]
MPKDFMDFVNSIIVTVFQPKIFPYFLSGLAGLSIWAIIIYIVQSSRQAKCAEDEKSRLTKYWQDQLKNYLNVNAEFSKSAESLKTQLGNQASQLQSLKLEFNNKDDILRKEILAKEKLWEEFKNAESRLSALKNKLEAGERELTQANKLKEDLNKREDELKKEILAKEKLCLELKNAESRLEKNHAEQKSLQEVHNGLKEQYADLERQVDALNQSLALEKTLSERLKEEESKCAKPAPL